MNFYTYIFATSFLHQLPYVYLHCGEQVLPGEIIMAKELTTMAKLNYNEGNSVSANREAIEELRGMQEILCKGSDDDEKRASACQLRRCRPFLHPVEARSLQWQWRLGSRFPVASLSKPWGLHVRGKGRTHRIREGSMEVRTS